MTQEATIFGMQAELYLAMGHAIRLKIVYLLLKEGPKRVNSIAESLEINQTTISRHLALLRNVGILTARRQGTDMIYQIASPKIVSVCDLMRDMLAERESQRSEIAQKM
ncbi:MAG: metalloregulator ArsR/SmtB family transcription factor [Acidithiobacillus sp.]|nr:metalloregulator ArsR/SmtB family transcription factor [Acidithiobacillus sp.]